MIRNIYGESRIFTKYFCFNIFYWIVLKVSEHSTVLSAYSCAIFRTIGYLIIAQIFAKVAVRQLLKGEHVGEGKSIDIFYERLESTQADFALKGYRKG